MADRRPLPTLSDVESKNLTIVFAGLCGYADRLGTLTWEDSQRLLRLHEALVDPAFRKFGGRRIKQTGATFLVAFDSPTQAVLCSAALCVEDRDQNPIALFKSEWNLNYAAGQHTGWAWSPTAPDAPLSKRK